MAWVDLGLTWVALGLTWDEILLPLTFPSRPNTQTPTDARLGQICKHPAARETNMQAPGGTLVRVVSRVIRGLYIEACLPEAITKEAWNIKFFRVVSRVIRGTWDDLG